ncbi:MAG: energy transducer TonB, partial [Nitrospirae bacterium]
NRYAYNKSYNSSGKRTKKRGDLSPVPFDTTEIRYVGYLERLRQRIETVWRYPIEAARAGIEGKLYIRFTILKDGRLGEVKLLRTSGFRVLDEAAIEALRDGQPYWPLPDAWNKDSLTIEGHFIYMTGRGYIR